MAAASRSSSSDDVANASGGIVERHRLDARMRAKELAALVQRHRMREHLPHRVQLHAGQRNQVVADPQMEFAMHEHFAREQQVEVLGHRAGQRILDRDDGSLHRAALHPVKHLRRPGTRNHGRSRQHVPASLVAERTELSLNRDFHDNAQSIPECAATRRIRVASPRKIYFAISPPEFAGASQPSGTQLPSNVVARH